MNGGDHMDAKRYTVRAPGKLFIAGEYAVTEPNRDSIVVAVDRYLTVDIQSSQQNRMDLLELKLTGVRWEIENNQVNFSVQDKRLNFMMHVLETFNAYHGEMDPVQIVVTSDLNDRSGKKYGLGSSAALSVAVIAALLKCSTKSEEANDPLIIFKLASIAHFKAQGNGSCADIASSTFGGWIHYSTFDNAWLLQQLAAEVPVSEIVQMEWPSLKIVPLKKPSELHFLIGWTDKAAQTGPMVQKVKTLETTHPEQFESFLTKSDQAVAEIITGFEQKNPEVIFAGIRANRKWLREIGTLAGVPIETEQLTMLIEAASTYGASKTSGAGGGDCGIAFVTSREAREKVFKAWGEVGITPLDLNVSTDGVIIH